MVTLVLALALNVLSAAEKADGWVLLFDGKTFQGWEDRKGSDSWTIDDGTLHSKSKPKRRDDLLTTSKWDNFELTFEWKISKGGNSGVKYRIQDRFFINESRADKTRFKRFEDLAIHSLVSRDTPRDQATQEYIIGFEYQVIDDSSHTDALRGPFYQAGALYDMIAAAERAAKPVGEFNVARVVVRGTHTEHYLNGVKVVDGEMNAPEVKQRIAKRWTDHSPLYDALANQPKKATPVGLQNHGDEAWFRNIKIRKLK
jgi:hypothetical protein